MSDVSPFNTLAVASSKDQILKLIEEYDGIVLTSNTGSGKTLGIPKFLNDAGYTVLCLEPRNILAISSAESASEMNGTKVGDDFGYMVTKTVDQQSEYSDNTKTIYATFSYALMRQLVLKPDASPIKFDVLILDEIHENILAQTILLGMLHKYLKQLGVKLVVMSATLDPDKMKNYFYKYKFSSIHIDNSTHPLKISEEEEEGSADSLAHQALKYLYQEDRNGCIVFVDGIADVKETFTVLNKIKTDMGYFDLELLTISSESSAVDRKLFFSELPENKKRIGIATSIAESGLSAKWIDCGTSNGMGKRWQLSGEDQLVLMSYPLAQWRIIQQAGRTNRFGPGVFTVFTGDISINERPKETEAEINLLPLDTLVLYCAYAGTNATELKFFPSKEHQIGSITQCQYTLVRDGCLEQDTFKITPKGEFFLMTPLGTKEALNFLYVAKNKGTMDFHKYLIYAGLLDNGSFHTSNVRDDPHVLTSDIEAMYRDVAAYMNHSTYDIEPSGQFLITNGISPARFRSVRDVILRLEENQNEKTYIPSNDYEWFVTVKECRRIQFLASYDNLYIVQRSNRRGSLYMVSNSKGNYQISHNSTVLDDLQENDLVIAYPKVVSSKKTGSLSAFATCVTRYAPAEIRAYLNMLFNEGSITTDSYLHFTTFYKNYSDGTSEKFGMYPTDIFNSVEDPLERFTTFIEVPKDTSLERLSSIPGPRLGFRFRL